MPNKKYKIAVIQLNLNDIAENNLKNVLLGDAANQGAEVISLPELYSSHYFIKVKTLIILLWLSLYSTSLSLLVP
jgi:N-carbamoylputrescine amidase